MTKQNRERMNRKTSSGLKTMGEGGGKKSKKK